MSELFLPFRRCPIEPITHVRSTVILSGIQSLRSQGLFPRYTTALSDDWRERILGLGGASWAPVEVAVEHYKAMDRLEIDSSAIEAIGAEVAKRAWRHTLSPAFVRSKRIGPDVWESLSHAHDTTGLNWRGGDIRIFRENSTQGLFEWVGQPCASVPYFVTSFGAVMRALVNLFAARAYHRLVPDRCSATTLAFRLSWTGAPK
jgi:hypothetical protein